MKKINIFHAKYQFNIILYTLFSIDFSKELLDLRIDISFTAKCPKVMIDHPSHSPIVPPNPENKSTLFIWSSS